MKSPTHALSATPLPLISQVPQVLELEGFSFGFGTTSALQRNFLVPCAKRSRSACCSQPQRTNLLKMLIRTQVSIRSLYHPPPARPLPPKDSHVSFVDRHNHHLLVANVQMRFGVMFDGENMCLCVCFEVRVPVFVLKPKPKRATQLPGGPTLKICWTYCGLRPQFHST